MFGIMGSIEILKTYHDNVKVDETYLWCLRQLFTNI